MTRKKTSATWYDLELERIAHDPSWPMRHLEKGIAEAQDTVIKMDPEEFKLLGECVEVINSVEPEEDQSPEQPSS